AGLTDSGKALKSWDNGVAVGGPIRKDRAWFFVAPRFWGNRNHNPGGYYNKTQHTPFYTPDLSNPANADLADRDLATRVTFQLTAKNKVSVGYNRQKACFCTYVASSSLAPEAFVSYHFNHHLTEATWQYPATNKLLFQGGVLYGSFGLSSTPTGDVQPSD